MAKIKNRNNVEINVKLKQTAATVSFLSLLFFYHNDLFER